MSNIQIEDEPVGLEAWAEETGNKKALNE